MGHLVLCSVESIQSTEWERGCHERDGGPRRRKGRRALFASPALQEPMLFVCGRSGDIVSGATPAQPSVKRTHIRIRPTGGPR